MRAPYRIGGATVIIFAAAVTVWSAGRPAASDWEVIAWPFPRDAWPAGLAFACAPATCGAGIRLYLRPKRGFCANCDTGVTSDAEVDGVADLDMITADFKPLASGETLTIGDLAGRQRAYTLLLPQNRRALAVGMALTRHKQCDLVVAVAVGSVDERARTAIAALLASERISLWLDRQLDGR